MDSFESTMNPRFLAESEKGMRAKSNQIREGNGRRFQGRRKGKEMSLFHHRSVWDDFPSSMFLCRLCMQWVLWWGWSLHWEEQISGAVICKKLMVYRVVSYDIRERCSVQDEENGPQYWALRHTVHELWWWRRRVISLMTEADWYLSERYDWNHWSAVDWMPKTGFRRERRIWWSIVSKAAERSNKRRIETLSLSRAERISFTIRNKTVSVLCPAR